MDFLDFIRKVAQESKERYIEKHYGPGPHKRTGTPQSIHAGARQRKGTPKKGGKGQAAFQRGANAAKSGNPGVLARTKGSFSLDAIIERLGPTMSPRTAGLNRFTGRVDKREALKAARKVYDLAAAEAGARVQVGKKALPLKTIRNKIAGLYRVSSNDLEG